MIPTHLHDSLKLACHAAIKAGTVINDVKIERWAETFGCDEGHVARMWEHELTKLSREPRNLETHDD